MTDIDWACSQPIMSVYNASGSIYFNGFHPASDLSHSPGNWSLNTAIHNVDNFTANTSMLYQTLWLDTSPTVELSSPQLTYRGCVFGFNDGLLASGAVSTYANENNSCNDVLAMTCQENILSLAKSYAIASVGTNNSCDALVDELSPQSSFMSGCQYNAFDGYQNEGENCGATRCCDHSSHTALNRARTTNQCIQSLSVTHRFSPPTDTTCSPIQRRRILLSLAHTM